MNRTDLRVGRPGGGSLHVHQRDDGLMRPAVIFSHGFTVDGAESHRIFLRMADRYNALGISTINFDYYGCGYSDGDFTDFSLSNAVADLGTILDWTRLQPGIDSDRILVHGQSLGTAAAAVLGSRRDDISAFVLWNLSADLPRRYSAMLGPEIFDTGFTWIRDKGYRVNKKFMEDIQQYDILACFESWRRPTHFLSSGEDTTGEPALAERACRSIGALGSRTVIAGANHSFKCQPDLEALAISATSDWVVAHFGLTPSG